MIVLLVPRLPQLPVVVQLRVQPRRAENHAQAEAQRGQERVHAGRSAKDGGKRSGRAP